MSASDRHESARRVLRLPSTAGPSVEWEDRGADGLRLTVLGDRVSLTLTFDGLNALRFRRWLMGHERD